MNNQQRNKLIAQELRALAEIIEYDTNEVIAAITVYPSPENTRYVVEQYAPNGKSVLYSGQRYAEVTALNDKLRIRVARGDE